MTATQVVTSVTREHRDGSFWHRLTEVERTAFAANAQFRYFAKGSELISAGDRSKWAAVIYSGRVRIVDDERKVVGMRWAGDIVGEQAVIDASARPGAVLADTNVRAILLGKQELEGLFARFPHAVLALCAVVSERLQEADRLLQNQANDAFTRVVDSLVHLAGQVRGDEHGLLRIPIGSQSAFAEQLRLSRESVVRALRTLRSRRLISTDRRGVVVVHDLAALRAT
ncbi:Crp/Fnr family transcriptional regulator [Lentzea sp. JNUCC 0626]|uniref:Crp/Fnr family transcriptional regulator n=1 Tax=Lentzea sp. JNUCC 0626 TaxID=3367513 RepID=UPI003748BD46